MECGICYAYRLNDAIPDKACDDPRCSQPFHNTCLYEVSDIVTVITLMIKVMTY